MVRNLNPVENVLLDNSMLGELYRQQGVSGAENIISGAMEEIAFRLARARKGFDGGDLDDLRRVARSLAAISVQLGMRDVARVAMDVCDLTQRNDGAALAATTARLLRLGEKSLIAVWDIQDLSV